MLYLWMPEANGVWQWSRGENWMQASSLEQLIQDIKPYQGEEAVVFFPSRDVQIIQQKISKAQYKQLGNDGVKYLIEEYVIFPIDQMKVIPHFEAPDQLSILAIAKNAVLTMQHSLTLIPVKVTALLPDFLVLPIPKDNETIIANVQQQLLVRESAMQGSSVDDLSLYLDMCAKPEIFKYDALTDEQSTALLAITTTEQRESFNYQFQPILKAKSHPFNVLPKAKREESHASGYWKACAMLLMALLVVQFSYDLARWVKLKKLADQTAVLSIEQYKIWFGANSRVTEQNIKSLFESNLRLSQTANTQALQLISRVGPILMQNQIVANNVNYDANVLNMNLVARSSDALQTLVSQLNQQGFKAELGNIQTQADGVIGAVKIQ